MLRRDPNQLCVNTIGVENLGHTIESVLSSGGSIALPKMPVPGVGWLAYCNDTERHIFGICRATHPQNKGFSISRVWRGARCHLWLVTLWKLGSANVST
jgi:hypothetical protein